MGHTESEILDLYFHMHDREAQAAINGLDFGTSHSQSAITGQKEVKSA